MSHVGGKSAVNLAGVVRGRPAQALAGPVQPHRRSRIQEPDANDLVPDAGPLQALMLVLDGQWRIVEGNPNWFELAGRDSYEFALTPGQSFKRYCEWCALWGSPEASIPLEAMRAIDEGADHFTRTYKLRRGRRKLTVTVFEAQGERFTVLSRLDLTELFKLRRDRLWLEGKLASAESALVAIREYERQRIARELHDGAAQCLVGIRLGLAELGRKSADPGVIAIANDLSALVEQFQADLRFVTYTLHPPMLEQLGLHRALQTLCATFTARTGIDIGFVAYGESGPKGSAVDAAVYRLVQEALTNVHKHASALRAHVRLVERENAVTVAVIDNGIGIEISEPGNWAAPPGSGLGIPGMTSRAHEIGGRVVVHKRATGRGTIVAAIFPRQAW